MEIEKFYNKAIYALGRRDYGRVELAKKLDPKKQHDKEVAAVLDKLERQGYLDEQRFIQVVVSSLMQRGKGRLFILAYIKQKGVDEESILSVLNTYTAEDWLNIARREAQKKTTPTNKEQQQKLIKFLMMRGFEYQIAKQAIQR